MCGRISKTGEQPLDLVCNCYQWRELIRVRSFYLSYLVDRSGVDKHHVSRVST